MSAGRRGLLLSVAFLGLALCLMPAKRAHAQPRRGGFNPPAPVPQDPGAGQHRIWQQSLNSDQVRDALSKFSKGDPNGNDAMLNLLRQVIGEQNPKATPEQVDAAAKKLLNDKEFRDAVMDAMQKHKNENPNAWNNNNPRPKITQEDLAKWLRVKPDGGNGDPFKVPDNIDPRQFQPFDPRNPKFDPKKFPAIDPDNPPQFDPKNGFPINPDTGKPFDPRNGKPLDPKDLQPFNPKNPFFDPKRFPAIDPEKPPRIDPKTGFPVDPDTGKPFDPRNGQPIDPKNPPKIDPLPQPEPVNPKLNPPDFPPQPPKIDQPNLPDNRKFDPENPLGLPPDAPDRAAKNKAVDTATALWEKNVGPIEESPGVKRALIDLMNDPDAMKALTDDKGNNIFDVFSKEGANGDDFGNLFGGNDSNWEWPKFDWNWGRNRDNDTDIDWGRGRNRDRDRDNGWFRDTSRSSGSSSFDSMGSFNLGGMQVPWVLLLIILAVIIAMVVWWKWGGLIKPRQATVDAADGGGGWPIDPREINTREDVVKAFEYLSVMLCGPGAKTWTHSTIADELSALAASEPQTAMKLARLYELARYAPLDEPLTRVELLEARRLVCELAGMDEV